MAVQVLAPAEGMAMTREASSTAVPHARSFMSPDEIADIEFAFAQLRDAGLRDVNVQRDRWQEALWGARLKFHATSLDDEREYWSGVYRRWSQLYQRSRDLGLTR